MPSANKSLVIRDAMWESRGQRARAIVEGAATMGVDGMERTLRRTTLTRRATRSWKVLADLRGMFGILLAEAGRVRAVFGSPTRWARGSGIEDGYRGAPCEGIGGVVARERRPVDRGRDLAREAKGVSMAVAKKTVKKAVKKVAKKPAKKVVKKAVKKPAKKVVKKAVKKAKK
jgi:hypothetical protein